MTSRRPGQLDNVRRALTLQHPCNRLIVPYTHIESTPLLLLPDRLISEPTRTEKGLNSQKSTTAWRRQLPDLQPLPNSDFLNCSILATLISCTDSSPPTSVSNPPGRALHFLGPRNIDCSLHHRLNISFDSSPRIFRIEPYLIFHKHVLFLTFQIAQHTAQSR
jgi:hypothetical protein